MIGSFVHTNTIYGLGKIITFNDLKVEVEFFESIAVISRSFFSISEVTPVTISPQTRCYVKKEDNWKVGRVRQLIDNEVEVDFPESQSEYVALQNVYIRCGQPLKDPTEILARWGHETVFFYERRKKFLEGLLTQRAISGGLTGLLSSSINLLPHQIKVARTILNDPIPRYLLADEVGLGKTIEAGIIIRQFILDNDATKVLVLTPSTLLQQWKYELIYKFHIDIGSPQIDIYSVDSIPRSLSKTDYNLVVIDEAHHLSEWCYSDSLELKNRYILCRDIAHKSPGLLLLSATPAVHHERMFLCMLNFLDPHRFEIDKVNEFKELLAKREEIAKVLFALYEGNPDFIIQDALQGIRLLLGSEADINLQINKLEDYFNEQPDITKRNKIISDLRLFISEGYQIYRRIVRNKRTDVWQLQRGIPFMDSDEDEFEERILFFLNDYRLEALEWTLEQPQERERYQKLYFLLMAAMRSGYGFMKNIVKFRLSGELNQIMLIDLSEEERYLLVSPLFPDEKVLLDRLHTYLNDIKDSSKEELLIGRLQMLQEASTRSKVVIFVSYSSVASLLAQRLLELFGLDSTVIIKKGLTKEEVEESIEEFKDNPSQWILVSDQIGEEGLNLQFAEILIHYDLPWSPNRIEQRIGRLDRIGQQKKIKSFVFFGEVEDITLSPDIAYFMLLKDALGIFDKSTNVIQLVIDSIVEQFKIWIFEEIGNFTDELIAQKLAVIKTEVENERKRIRDQDMLDQFANAENNDERFITTLDRFERESAKVKTLFEPWIVQALLIRKTEREGVVNYQWTPNTLIPIDQIRARFDDTVEFSGSYDRSIAFQKQIELYRIGNPFIDALESYFQWDDRGKAFAIWRKNYLLEDWQGFKFEFIVEANEAFFVDMSLPTQKALKRRADELFPPFQFSIYVSVEGEVEKDEQILKVLDKPIAKYDKNKNPFGYDYNIKGDSLSILKGEFIDFRWEAICIRAREVAFNHIITLPEFNENLLAGKAYAESYRAKRLATLKINHQHIFKESVAGVNLEEAMADLLLQSIQRPSLQVDSVGFIWLSSNTLIQP